MASFQTTANIRKTPILFLCIKDRRHNLSSALDKLCLLSFMHRNKIGLLTPFAKINKRGSLHKVRGGGKKV